MIEAFILVQTHPGAAAHITEQVRSIEGVTEVQMVTGPYDVIARVRVADLHALDVLLEARMKTLDGVLRVLISTIESVQGAAE